MRKKIILTIAVIALIAIAAAVFIATSNKEHGPVPEDTRQGTETVQETGNAPEVNTQQTENTPIQFGETEDGERPDYTASEYIKGYTPVEKPAEDETEETEPVSDAEVLGELEKRAADAGISTDKTLGNEDAAIISNQRYQTLDEYKAYLKKAIAERNAFSKKSDAFSEYMDTLAENSEMSEIPSDLKAYEDKYVEEHLEERAEMFGTTLDKIKEEGMYDTFKQTAIEQNEDSIKLEMYIKYIAEQEGIALEDGDVENMLEFYDLIYGWKQVEQMKATYTEAQFETEALYYKLVTTLF